MMSSLVLKVCFVLCFILCEKWAEISKTNHGTKYGSRLLSRLGKMISKICACMKTRKVTKMLLSEQEITSCNLLITGQNEALPV